MAGLGVALKMGAGRTDQSRTQASAELAVLAAEGAMGWHLNPVFCEVSTGYGRWWALRQPNHPPTALQSPHKIQDPSMLLSQPKADRPGLPRMASGRVEFICFRN